MESKHTPGPWWLGVSEHGRHFRAVDAKGHGELATVVWLMDDDDLYCAPSPECEANARLIAAAPDLLEALIKVTTTLAWNAHGECRAIHDGPIMPSSQAIEVARAAIAKAKGEEQ